jgi:magnesium transporter
VLTVHVNCRGRSEIDTDLLESAVRLVLHAEGVERGEVSVTLLGDDPIREMNRDYLGHDRPTDVIAFALHGEGEPVLGDVYVGVEQAERQAVREGVPARDELARLAIHGTLHVLGYDHPDGEGRSASPMFERQERLMAELLGDRTGGSPEETPDGRKSLNGSGTPEETLIAELRQLIESGESERLQEILAGMHPSDVADLVESIDDSARRVAFIRALPSELASETLSEMEEGEQPAELLAALGPVEGAALVHELDDDDAADLIADLEPADRDRILAELPEDEAEDIEGLLQYDEETAGGLMTTALVSVPERMTAAEAIAEVRKQGREVEDFYTVFVVDDRGRLQGTVPLDDLILADPHEPVASLVQPVVTSVLPELDQEEVGRLLGRYNLVSVPVVNEFGTLLGRITFDDVIDVIEAEQTEDILRLAGGSEDEEVRARWTDAVRERLPWLLINLLPATLAAAVVYAFDQTIENVVILAAVMPIIAATGGNAGTQALAVTIRRISLAGGRAERGSPVSKEIKVGLANGAAIGATVAVLAAVVPGGNPVLGLVVLIAMWGTVLMGGFTGAFVPTVLNRAGIDPAVASAVFVTTLTDMFGFFLLLGLASMLLL